MHDLGRDNLFCYLREDRRGLFMLKEQPVKKKLDMVGKFHLDSMYTNIQEGISEVPDLLTRLDSLYKFHYLETYECFEFIFKLRIEKTFMMIRCGLDFKF
jgi:hypothetical protein